MYKLTLTQEKTFGETNQYTTEQVVEFLFGEYKEVISFMTLALESSFKTTKVTIEEVSNNA